jgi:hypothetical protein
MSEREHRPEDEDELDDEPKVIHLHGRDFAGTSFAANEEEQTRDKEDPNARPDIDDKNTVERIQDHGLKEP